MIGIVLVSHSKALAAAIVELVAQMAGPEFPVAVAAGVGEEHDGIGTDAVHIAEVLRPFCNGDGAVVLMDLGSAVLSAQAALELLEADTPTDRIRLCPAPMVEAAVAAAVVARSGAELDAVAAEAIAALAPKQAQLREVCRSTGLRAGVPDNGTAGAAASASPPHQAEQAFEFVVANPHGLHARPAATLVQMAGQFRSDLQLSNLTTGRGPAAARSMIGVGLLQARQGDRIRVTASGSDAEAALQSLAQLAAAGFGELAGQRGGDARPAAPAGASEGIALGRPLRLAAALPIPADGRCGSPNDERSKLDRALGHVAGEIRATADAGGPAGKIFAAQALMLSDPGLLEAVHRRIEQGGVSAFAAWQMESAAVADAYAAIEDDYLRARAADLRDIAARVARGLGGQPEANRIAPDPPAILLADELLPSEAAACDPRHVLGVLARAGSPTAHAAIIARTLGIPMVVGAASADFDVLSRASLLAIDGVTGDMWVDPTTAALADIEARRQALAIERAAADRAGKLAAVTVDGQVIEVLANVGNAADAMAARDNSAEGVGLLRTEFLLLGQSKMPDEERQVQALAEVLANLGPGPVVVRTPDIGADKPLAFLPRSSERNPFLGVRGLRLSFRHPEVFATNLRAILRAGADKDLWVMFPMISGPDEMARARAFTTAAHDDLAKAGKAHRWPVKLGMMIEVPAAALMADRFVGQADFFSIGTNDLTQYLLAAERGNADLGGLQDAAHPAVLRVVRDVCEKASGRHVSVCGEAASDPLAAALMIGAGIRSLSVRPNRIGAVKAQVRRASLAALRQLADEAMRCDTAADVRQLAGKTAGC
jgi:phosphocarrier protein FPr